MEIDCRGKNGSFILGAVEVFKDGNKVRVSVWSHRRGLSPPISFYGGRLELLDVFTNILEKIKSIKN